MMDRGDGVMTFEKWKEAMSRGIFIVENDKSGILNKLVDIFVEDLDEEESKPLRLKKKKWS